MTLYMRDLEQQEIAKDKEQRDRILYMLGNGKTPQEITDFCGYPITLVNEVKENMTTAVNRP